MEQVRRLLYREKIRCLIRRLLIRDVSDDILFRKAEKLLGCIFFVFIEMWICVVEKCFILSFRFIFLDSLFHYLCRSLMLHVHLCMSEAKAKIV